MDKIKEIGCDSNEKSSNNDSSINGRIEMTDEFNSNEVLEGEKGGTLDKRLYSKNTGCGNYCESCGSFRDDLGNNLSIKYNNSAQKVLPSKVGWGLMGEQKDSFDSREDVTASNMQTLFSKIDIAIGTLGGEKCLVRKPRISSSFCQMPSAYYRASMVVKRLDGFKTSL